MSRVSSSQLKQNTKSVIEKVIKRPETNIIVCNYNKPVAVIISYEEWLRLKKPEVPAVNGGKTAWDKIKHLIPKEGVEFDSTAYIRELRDE